MNLSSIHQEKIKEKDLELNALRNELKFYKSKKN